LAVSHPALAQAGLMVAAAVVVTDGAVMASSPLNGRVAAAAAALRGTLAPVATAVITQALLPAEVAAEVALAVLVVALLAVAILAVAAAVSAFTVKGPTGRHLLALVPAVAAVLAALQVSRQAVYAAVAVAAVLLEAVEVQDESALFVLSGLAVGAAHLHSLQLMSEHKLWNTLI
jgi:hypothetical protein